MKKVKIIKPLPGYLADSIVEFDENSAAKLIERGDAVAYDGPESSTPVVGRGNVQVVQVREADLPDEPATEQPAAEPDSTELGAVVHVAADGTETPSVPDADGFHTLDTTTAQTAEGTGTPPQGTEVKPGETSPEITSAEVSSKVTAARGAGGGGGGGTSGGGKPTTSSAPGGPDDTGGGKPATGAAGKSTP